MFTARTENVNKHPREQAHQPIYLFGPVSKQEPTIVCQFLPYAIDPLDLGLASQNALSTDFASDARHLGGEIAKLVHHGVYRALEGCNFRVHFHIIQPYSLRQITTGNCS